MKKKDKIIYETPNQRNVIYFMFNIEILPKKYKKIKEPDVPKKRTYIKKKKSLAI